MKVTHLNPSPVLDDTLTIDDATYDGEDVDWDTSPLPLNGPLALDDLYDVNVPAPDDGDALTWDDYAAEWVPVHALTEDDVLAIITPTIDPVNQGLVMAPMILLYFVSIGLSYIAVAGRKRNQAQDQKIADEAEAGSS